MTYNDTPAEECERDAREYEDSRRAAMTEHDALALLEATANTPSARRYFVIYDGAWLVYEAADLELYHPNATIVAQSHCPVCDCRMVNPLSDACAIHSEYAGEHGDEAIRAEPILFINNMPQMKEAA